MQVDQLRGLLYEFGVSFRTGRVAGLNEICARMAELEDALPGIMIFSLQDQLRRIDAIERDIDQLEKQISGWLKQEAACRAIAEIPGIGKLTATALVATMGDAKTFKSGREVAPFLGLVPRQSGTGGKIRLGSISKRGDPHVRTLLIHGARSVMRHVKTPTSWQKGILERRPANVVKIPVPCPTLASARKGAFAVTKISPSSIFAKQRYFNTSTVETKVAQLDMQ
ncbi:transposase [Paraburkholderia sp. MM5477-R1]